MAQPSDNLRDRLLASLPQPENLTAYREETAALLAKQAYNLRWEKIFVGMIFLLCLGFFAWADYIGIGSPQSLHLLLPLSAVMFFAGAINHIRVEIYANQIANLKEIKQVQLQILELQASLQKER